MSARLLLLMSLFVLLVTAYFVYTLPPNVTPRFAVQWEGNIALKRGGKGPDRIEVAIVDRHTADRLSDAPLTPDQWRALLAVYVEQGAQTNQPAILGSYGFEGGKVYFEPRFPFTPGLSYRAILDPTQFPGNSQADFPRIVRVFEIPRLATAPTTVVQQVYPTRARLPENQLKFYIHFSAPMSQGEAYDHIHLFDASDKEVEVPFLRLYEELWDPAGQRFTLFFDPGRIKRELVPRQELGPALVTGKTYIFVIDKNWNDAQGNPLKESFRKTFTVMDPDERQPDPRQWRIQAPSAGGTDALDVAFPEPLDHALLNRLLWVVDGQGQRIGGTIAVTDEETRWRFTPEKPWAAGPYRLMIDTALEDLAGNSVARPFEVDVFRPIQRQVLEETVEQPFEIKAK
jgi:hypothetical protein